MFQVVLQIEETESESGDTEDPGDAGPTSPHGLGDCLPSTSEVCYFTGLLDSFDNRYDHFEFG